MTDDSGLIKNLRALSRCEHDDHSIGDEAADLITALCERVTELDGSQTEAWAKANSYAQACERAEAALTEALEVVKLLDGELADLGFARISRATAFLTKHGAPND